MGFACCPGWLSQSAQRAIDHIGARASRLSQRGAWRIAAGRGRHRGEHSRACLDADSKRDIHQRVGATILFKSSGGQIDKVAHLPELRFALGAPDLDTTSIDNAALYVSGWHGWLPNRLSADLQEMSVRIYIT